MKLIISGAGGFLGRNILTQLLLSEKSVTEIIALSSNISQLSLFENCEKMKIISNQDFLSKKINLSSYTLIHLAYARSSDFQRVKQSCEFAFDLFEKCKNYGLKRIIHISSQSVYDPKRTKPAVETDLVRLSTPYDMGKYYLENWISDFCHKNSIDFLNLRIGSLVGPNFSQRITTRLVRNAIEKGKIIININGQLFSFTHVSDMVQAIIISSKNNNSNMWNKVYNVGSSETYNIEDIANNIYLIAKNNNIHLIIERKIVSKSGVNSSLDSTLFQDLTGWDTEYDLRSILREEFDYQIGTQREN